jgi:hypothetical protein
MICDAHARQAIANKYRRLAKSTPTHSNGISSALLRAANTKRRFASQRRASAGCSEVRTHDGYIGARRAVLKKQSCWKVEWRES